MGVTRYKLREAIPACGIRAFEIDIDDSLRHEIAERIEIVDEMRKLGLPLLRISMELPEHCFRLSRSRITHRSVVLVIHRDLPLAVEVDDCVEVAEIPLISPVCTISEVQEMMIWQNHRSHEGLHSATL